MIRHAFKKVAPLLAAGRYHPSHSQHEPRPIRERGPQIDRLNDSEGRRAEIAGPALRDCPCQPFV